jgi:hypothetical protein
MGTLSQRITEAVLTFDGVTSAPHRFGGIEFNVGTREVGHLHGDRMADLPFPKRVRDRLIAEGKAQPHHLLADTGWVSYYLRDESDIAPVIELFRLNHHIITDRKAAMADYSD